MSREQEGPTVVCAWCGLVLREGGFPRSHGICRPCAARFLAELQALEMDRPGAPVEGVPLTIA